MGKKIFGDIKLFGRKVDREKKIIEEIQKEKQKLSTRLKTLSFKTKKISEEQISNDRRRIALLIIKLSDGELSIVPDTREIDHELYKLCDELEDAYRKGDSISAYYIIETLMYGIVNGHRPLTAVERKYEEKVIQCRKEKLNSYFHIVCASENIFSCKKGIAYNTNKLKIVEEEFEKEWKKLSELLAEDLPVTYEPIVNAIMDSKCSIENLRDMNEKLSELEEQCLACDKECFSVLQNVFRKRYESTMLKENIRSTLEMIESFETNIFYMEMVINQPEEFWKEKFLSYRKREFPTEKESLSKNDITLKDEISVKKIGSKRKLQKEILAETQKLSDRLKAISFRSNKISEEQIKQDQGRVESLLVTLRGGDNSLLLDTRKMDRALYELCDELQEAYRRGDKWTAHYIIEAFSYGIVNGHKSLTEDERKRKAEVIQWREKNIERYCMIVTATTYVFSCKMSVRKNMEQLEKKIELFKQRFQEIPESLKEELPLAYHSTLHILEDYICDLEHLKEIQVKLSKMRNERLEYDKERFSNFQDIFRIRQECIMLKEQLVITQMEIHTYIMFACLIESKLEQENECKK